MARNMKKILIGTLTCLLSFSSLAESYTGSGYWHGPYTIDKESLFHDGKYYITSIHVNEVPETQCEVTNTEKKFHYLSEHRGLVNDISSLAATAQAQNKRVMLYSKGTCRSGTYNLGLEARGIEILSE